MQINRPSAPSRNSLQRLSPPALTEESLSTADTAPLDRAEARPNERPDGFSRIARIGLLALAAGSALAGCKINEPTPPISAADDPGAFEMEDPSFVYLGPGTTRIDLAREQDLECPAFHKDISECEWVDEPYSPYGIHLGHGVVEDFNGNLMAIPQLAVDNSFSAILENPEYVSIGPDGRYYNRETEIRQTAPGSFSIGATGAPPSYTVELRGSEASVKSYNSRKKEYTEMISVEQQSDSSVLLNGEYGYNLRSQGDHFTIQKAKGGFISRLQYDSDSYRYMVSDAERQPYRTYTFENGAMSYPVDAPAWFDDYTVTYRSSSNADGGFESSITDNHGTRSYLTMERTGDNEGRWTWSGYRSKEMKVQWRGGEMVNGPSAGR